MSTAIATETTIVLMDQAEARRTIEQIKAHFDGARRLLLDLEDREGWRALGYKSWRECTTAEFGQSQAYLYRQLTAAKIERALDSPIGEIPESHLRPLAQLDTPAEQHQALDRATEIAGNGKRTAAHVQQAVDEIKPPAEPAPTDGPDLLSDKEYVCTHCGQPSNDITVYGRGLVPEYPDRAVTLCKRCVPAILAARQAPPTPPDLAELDRTLPGDLNRAGFFWKSADPPTIANNDGRLWQARTTEDALALARAALHAPRTLRESLRPALLTIDQAIDGKDFRGIAIGALKLLEAVMGRLPKTELIEDVSMAISDLNECEEGSEWEHWSSVGWALLDCEATP